MVNKYWKEVNILVYETLDGVSRIQYKDHIIQTYGYDDNKPDLNITHFIIDEDGNDVCEMDCLLKCIKYIDKRVK